MVAFQLDNTLSEFGSVTRGLCTLNGDKLDSVIETSGLRLSKNRMQSDRDILLNGKEPVSMNVWGFTPDLFEFLELMFKNFLEEEGSELKSEFLIPSVINSLIQKQEYKEFLGIEKFSDYISIPQRFACDNLRKVNKSVIKQLEKSSSDLFLLGVGHVKSGMLHRLKEHSNAVFLDIGVGVDALAGIVNLTRPYFGGWTNYQLKNQSIYSEVDFLVNKINNIKNIKFL